MSLYTVALFLHVSGAIGAFISLGIWLFGLAALRRARLVEQVRALAWLIILASPLMVGSVVLIGLAGLSMALSTWGLATPWIAVSLVSVVLSGPIGAFLLDPRMRTIMAMAREVPAGPLPDALILRTHDPILVTAATTLASMLLGIVALFDHQTLACHFHPGDGSRVVPRPLRLLPVLEGEAVASSATRRSQAQRRG